MQPSSRPAYGKPPHIDDAGPERLSNTLGQDVAGTIDGIR
jgi:hypothetical protein